MRLGQKEMQERKKYNRSEDRTARLKKEDKVETRKVEPSIDRE